MLQDATPEQRDAYHERMVATPQAWRPLLARRDGARRRRGHRHARGRARRHLLDGDRARFAQARRRDGDRGATARVGVGARRPSRLPPGRSHQPAGLAASIASSASSTGYTVSLLRQGGGSMSTDTPVGDPAIEALARSLGAAPGGAWLAVRHGRVVHGRPRCRRRSPTLPAARRGSTAASSPIRTMPSATSSAYRRPRSAAHGAVSEPTARAMAEGALRASQASGGGGDHRHRRSRRRQRREAGRHGVLRVGGDGTADHER